MNALPNPVFNLILIVGGYILSGLMYILFWVYRRDDERINKRQADTEERFNNWRLDSTAFHGQIQGRLNALEAGFQATRNTLQDLSIEVRRIAQQQARDGELLRLIDQKFSSTIHMLGRISGDEPK